MERAVLVYTTWPSIVEAERAGRAIVERRLAACVNILPGMISHYWWQGKIERAEEVVMLVKTRAALAEAVGDAVKQQHSYTTPAIMTLPVDSVDPDYHAWITKETGAIGYRRSRAVDDWFRPAAILLSLVLMIGPTDSSHVRFQG